MRDDVDRRVRLRPLVAGVALLALAAGIGAWILADGNGPLAADRWWSDRLAPAASPFLDAVSLVLDAVGRAWLTLVTVPALAAIALVVARRPWSAAFLLVSCAVGAILVQLLKSAWARPRPEDVAVLTDFGAFPSGHAANAAVIATAAFVLLRRWWVAVAGGVWVVLMALSRTYLQAHWLSDVIGGALVGAGAVLVVAAAFSGRIERERGRRRERRCGP